MDVGFVGLGHMGSAMARNVARAGHRVRAWNRSPVPSGQAEDFEIVRSVEEALDADIVMTMLSDDKAIREVLLDSGALGRVRKGAVHVVTATISVAFAGELARRHAEAGLAYVSAPVLGRPDVAAKGELVVLAGGAENAIERARPALEAIGKAIEILGTEPERANAAKIAINMMIAMALEAMGEAVALTKAHRIEPERFLGLVTGGLFASPAYKNYGGNILEGRFEPGFRMSLGLKDLRLAHEAAEASGKTLPMMEAVRAQMGRAVDAGMGDKDWSGVAGYTIDQD